MNFILFDTKESWQNLLPFTYTRAIGDIRSGILTIKEKWENLLGSNFSLLTQHYLAKKYQVRITKDNIFINSTVLPNKALVTEILKLKSGQVLVKNNFFIAEYGNKGSFEGFLSTSLDKANKVEYKYDLSIINSNWDIFTLNSEQIIADYNLITSNRISQELSPTNNVVGKGDIFIEDGAIVEYATLNTKDGPIFLGKNSEIMEGSMIRGPFALGNNAVVKMGAKIYKGTTIGPFCKVSGEINNSVFFAYSNKAHEGFIGNSVIGEWCNIGADSNNSNLKNNYTNVKVWNYSEERFVDTGLQFCGLFMGDHTKCGINTMFNTGTTIGVCSNIFGSGFPRTFIPSFSWGGAFGMTNYKVEKAIETVKLVLARRGVELSEVDENILIEIYNNTKKYRANED